MRKWISFPQSQGVASKQAHADFPEQAIYEREAGRSGFVACHAPYVPRKWAKQHKPSVTEWGCGEARG